MDKEKFLDWLCSYVEDLDLEQNIYSDIIPRKFYSLGCYEFIKLVSSLVSRGIFDLDKEDE